MSKILILGASSDIGIVVVKKFLKNNWDVTAHYNKNKKLKKIALYEKKLNLLKFDLKKIKKLENYVKKNKSRFYKYDAFVSLTGYLKPTSFENFNSKTFYDHLNVNFLSNIIFIRELLKGMSKRKFGRILLSSSIGTKFGGGLQSFAYSLSKFNNEFFPNFYRTLYSKNISINTLQIGVTDTKIHKNLKNKDMKKRLDLIPSKRFATKEEVANYILFLCDKNNTLLKGSVINISGGE